MVGLATVRDAALRRTHPAHGLYSGQQPGPDNSLSTWLGTWSHFARVLDHVLVSHNLIELSSATTALNRISILLTTLAISLGCFGGPTPHVAQFLYAVVALNALLRPFSAQRIKSSVESSVLGALRYLTRPSNLVPFYATIAALGAWKRPRESPEGDALLTTWQNIALAKASFFAFGGSNSLAT